MNPQGGSAVGYGEAQNSVGNVNQGQARPGQARTMKCYNCNGTGHIARNCTQPKRPQNSEYFNDKMMLMQAQENGVALDAEQLLFLAGGPDNAFDDNVDEQPIQDLALNVDNVFQAKDCDAFDSDVDEAPTAQTMFMANLSSVAPITDEAGPSYDSNILSEVQDHDQYLDDTCAYQEEHVMDDSVQLDHVVDLHIYYTSVCNMIPYDQYVKDNDVPVVRSNASSVKNDTFMMIYNDMCEPSTPSVSNSVEDTLEIAEITRKKMNAKMTDPKFVTHKRITPTAITDRERGFEQTKACYLQEAIPFFKTIKENFEGIQKALTKEVKEMKDVFKELESEVLSVATKSELNVARFAEMYVANTFVEALCLAFEAELATLRDKNYQENQGELIKHFSKLKVDHLNLQLKYQNLKDRIGNNPPTPDKDTPDFDFVFVIGKMQASLQGKDNIIRQLKKQLSQLQVQNDMFRAENDKIKQDYKELYDSIKITRAKHVEQVTKITTENMNLKTCVSKATIKPQVSTRDKHAIDVEPIVPRLKNNMDAHPNYLRHLKESVETIRDIVEEAKVVRPLDRSIVSACHYTKHSQELLEYAIGTCPQGSQQRAKQLAHIPLIRKKQVTVAKPSDKNDQFSAIMGYGDYVVGESVISRVYYMEGLGHNLFSVGQFCDSDLEVAFRKHSCYVRDTDGVDLIKGSRGSNLYTISVEDMMKSSPICLLSKASKNKSWLWHRRLNHLNFGTINDLARKDLV
nr:retrovirus-related Pol polyprotein from transposon TNT 1-94 [Tanacetum cinerariifolium]